MADKVKEHTTNYFDTFIEVAEDTKANKATKPISKGDKKSIGEMQYDLIDENPYYYTSDDIIFQVKKQDVAPVWALAFVRPDP